MGPNFLRYSDTLLIGNRIHPPLLQSLHGPFVLSKVELGAYQDDGNVGGVVLDFGKPFPLDVVEGRRTGNGEADQEDIGLGVREWPKTIVVFLSGRIPKAQADGLSVDQDACGIVIKPRRMVTREPKVGGERQGSYLHCRNVLSRKGVGSVGDQHASLAKLVSHRRISRWGLDRALPFLQLHRQ